MAEATAGGAEPAAPEPAAPEPLPLAGVLAGVDMLPIEPPPQALKAHSAIKRMKERMAPPCRQVWAIVCQCVSKVKPSLIGAC